MTSTRSDELARLGSSFNQMAIVRRTTALLGCPLACVSRPGRGTRFELLLPVSRDDTT